MRKVKKRSGRVGRFFFFFFFFPLKLEGRDWAGVAIVFSSNLLFLSANKSDEKALSQGSIMNNKVQVQDGSTKVDEKTPFQIMGQALGEYQEKF